MTTFLIEPKPGNLRYTVQTLAAGQTRAYGDSRQHVRVFIEWVPYGGDGTWQPREIKNEEWVREILKGLRCGFTEFVYPPTDRKPTEGDYFATRLDWLKTTAPGVWEFQTTSKSTD